VIRLREHMRLDPILRGVKEPYQYEREVEDFLRWSPNVRRSATDEATGHRPQATGPAPVRVPEPAGPPVEHYDDLEAEEVISLLGSLEAGDLGALRDYEAAGKGRDSVVAAIDAVLARRAAASRP
jgi:hypothetical protein